MYPVYFDFDSDVREEVIESSNGKLASERDMITASNEQEFTDVLKVIFNSKKAVRVISSMLAQANS